jgi:hypothetical protein
MNLKLDNRKFREELLENIDLYKNTTNISDIREWIISNLETKSNIIAYDLFELSSAFEVHDHQIIDFSKEVLEGKFYYFTKLACLDYLHGIESKISNKNYIYLNSLMAQSRYKILVFQANLNLINYDFDSRIQIINRILNNEDYPSLFYRLSNQLHFFSNEIQEKLIGYIESSLTNKKFSESIFIELKNTISRNSNS